ncbi:MAG TPA: beta-galactosidase, partial [Sphingomonas sp.]|nr:beta-galactosidase [Sphingomonas sp.]
MSNRGIAALLTAALLAGAPAVSAPPQTSAPFPERATAFANRPAIAVGTAWYPEQWPEARWDVDLAMMKATGFNTVRVGEFAWSRMEPEEGRFDFA